MSNLYLMSQLLMMLCIVERRRSFDTNFHASYFYFCFLLYFFIIVYKLVYVLLHVHGFA